MNAITLLLLAWSMSLDAFAANVAKGATGRKVGVMTMWQTAAIFGVVEMLTLLVGYLAGTAAARYIEAYDHWIAFVLLSLLGIRMMRESCGDDGVRQQENHSEKSVGLMFITAVATGIDSMIMGVSLALMDAPIVWVLLAVGAITAAMSALGLRLGQVLGNRVGNRVQMLGGVVLMAMGLMILLQHLQVI